MTSVVDPGAASRDRKISSLATSPAFGWIATMLIGSTLVGAVAARFPNFGERIPLFLVWLLPLLALPILAYVLMPFWTR